jgi:hypothetical protein
MFRAPARKCATAAGHEGPVRSPSGRGFSFKSSLGESYGARLRNSLRTPSSDSVFKQPAPSLRAQAKQSISAAQKKEWIASRSLSSGAHSRDPLARNDVATIPHTTSPSRRDASEALMNLPPKEGVGNAGCPLHPQPRVHLVVVERTRATTSTPESPGIPARNGFNGFLRALPGDRALLPPSSAD